MWTCLSLLWMNYATCSLLRTKTNCSFGFVRANQDGSGNRDLIAGSEFNAEWWFHFTGRVVNKANNGGDFLWYDKRSWNTISRICIVGEYLKRLSVFTWYTVYFYTEYFKNSIQLQTRMSLCRTSRSNQISHLRGPSGLQWTNQQKLT